jgi:hypothetical protein
MEPPSPTEERQDWEPNEEMGDLSGPSLRGMLTLDQGFTLDDVNPSFGTYFENAYGEHFRNNPVSNLYQMASLGFSEMFGEEMSNADAKSKIKESGYNIDIGDGPTTKEAVETMIERARDRASRQFIMSRYKPGFVTNASIGLLAGFSDPVNIAAGYIPIVGQARYAKYLKDAGSFAGRTGVRAGVGALEGGIGMAMVEPLNAAAKLQEGTDYGTDDFLSAIAFGTVFGTTLHTSFGSVGEVLRGFPYDIQKPAIETAISDVIVGEPVHSGEMVLMLSDKTPMLRLEDKRPGQGVMRDVNIEQTPGGYRLTIPGEKESGIQAYHGTPDEFTEFGATDTPYGHGIPLAESADVARVSQRASGNSFRKFNASELKGAQHDSDAAKFLDENKELNHNDLEDKAYEATEYANPPATKDGAGVYVMKDGSAIVVTNDTIRAVKMPGALVDARMKVRSEDFLDWDASLRNQSPNVREILKKAVGQENLTGSEIYDRLLKQLGSAKAVSDFLDGLGISGIKYSDDMSREVGKGTRNFVVFNKKNVAAASPDTSPVATAEISTPEAGKGTISNIWVRDDFRRKGVARQIHDFVSGMLGKEGRELVPSSYLKEAGFQFWSKYRPDAVKGDMRSHRDFIEAYAEDHFGKNVRVEFRSGDTATVFSDGKNVGEITKQMLMEEGILGALGIPKDSRFFVPALVKKWSRRNVAEEARNPTQAAEVIHEALLDLQAATFADPNASVKRIEAAFHQAIDEVTRQSINPIWLKAHLEAFKNYSDGDIIRNVARSWAEAFTGERSSVPDEIASVIDGVEGLNLNPDVINALVGKYTSMRNAYIGDMDSILSSRNAAAMAALEQRRKKYAESLSTKEAQPKDYVSDLRTETDRGGDAGALAYAQKIRAETEKQLSVLPKEKADAVREKLSKLDKEATDLENVISRVTECLFEAGGGAP